MPTYWRYFSSSAPKPGRPQRIDHEYQRKGTCCVFIAFDPHQGWRKISIKERRTKEDYADFMRELAMHYPDAGSIRVVQDNLNTHSASSFYEAFSPEVAFGLKKKFQFHFTPKKGSWLNMAEIEFSALSRQCLNRRIGDIKTLAKEAGAWEKDRNGMGQERRVIYIDFAHDIFSYAPEMSFLDTW